MVVNKLKKKLSKEAKQIRLLERESIRENREYDDYQKLKQEVSNIMIGYESLPFPRRLKLYQKYCAKKVFNAEYCPKCTILACHFSGRGN